MTPFPHAADSPINRVSRAKHFIGKLRSAYIRVEFQYRVLNYGFSDASGEYSEVLYPMGEDEALAFPDRGYPHIGMVPDSGAYTGNMLAPPPTGVKDISHFDRSSFIPYNDIFDESTELEAVEGGDAVKSEDHKRLSLRFRLVRPEDYDADIQTIRKDVPFRVSLARIDLCFAPEDGGIPEPEAPDVLFELGSDAGYFNSSPGGVEWGPWSGWIGPGGSYITQRTPGFTRVFRYSCLGRVLIHCGPTFGMTRAEAHDDWGA